MTELETSSPRAEIALFARALCEQRGIPRVVVAEELILIGESLMAMEQGAAAAADWLERLANKLRELGWPHEISRDQLN